jgi:hypothetical protein
MFSNNLHNLNLNRRTQHFKSSQYFSLLHYLLNIIDIV